MAHAFDGYTTHVIDLCFTLDYVWHRASIYQPALDTNKEFSSTKGTLIKIKDFQGNTDHMGTLVRAILS